MQYVEGPQDFEIPIANGYKPSFGEDGKVSVKLMENPKSTEVITPPKETKIANKTETLTPENVDIENEKKLISTEEPTHIHKNGCCVVGCNII